MITIPRSHIDNFNSHRGWWACFDDPELKPGENFVIKLDQEFIACGCVEVKNPGSHDKLNFINWWILYYVPEKINQLT